MKRRFFLPAAVLSCVAAATTAFSDDVDDGLYDAPPPEDAGFVRFVGYETLDAPDLFGLSIPDDLLASQDYLVVSAANHEGLEAGQYVTIIPGRDTAPIIHVEPARNREKVLATLINLSPAEAISLKTADGKIAVVAPIAPFEIAHREVNPIAVELAIFDGDAMLGEPSKVIFKRNQHVTYLVGNDGSVSRFTSGFTSNKN
ncbi:alginate O-acetyltransferase AlgF [Cognatishimia maritima]|uniref:Alginate biosynthesis protein AlgF n=1 Tax=Cognatishimia maritima TaxID=870908 RepID=A0A1M5P213_9RHOB|nr:alginate O-acetyltransferase AlgF [Cognatishimia maritima]SHG95856.1 Alginate O-acetyl transferase AlgF [Cognatishimia maritima]